MINLTLQVPIEWLIRVNRGATEAGISRAGLIQIAVDFYLANKGHTVKELPE